ncbi:hypothetical protein CBR_g40896 [Chara braunii]|uniref:Retrotransposon gag domain-containing protein n=1 Tax=Chara braunii TaxID=69332 RepID=A0A388K2C7_CHABU|nr:hypothetical protein CBR_g40896 [Chara braunii]|eukprot:GBG64196.1 hypothetical protein CBR_g40896 [Chara braunii]
MARRKKWKPFSPTSPSYAEKLERLKSSATLADALRPEELLHGGERRLNWPTAVRDSKAGNGQGEGAVVGAGESDGKRGVGAEATTTYTTGEDAAEQKSKVLAKQDGINAKGKAGAVGGSEVSRSHRRVSDTRLAAEKEQHSHNRVSADNGFTSGDSERGERRDASAEEGSKGIALKGVWAGISEDGGREGGNLKGVVEREEDVSGKAATVGKGGGTRLKLRLPEPEEVSISRPASESIIWDKKREISGEGWYSSREAAKPKRVALTTQPSPRPKLVDGVRRVARLRDDMQLDERRNNHRGGGGEEGAERDHGFAAVARLKELKSGSPKRGGRGGKWREDTEKDADADAREYKALRTVTARKDFIALGLGSGPGGKEGRSARVQAAALPWTRFFFPADDLGSTPSLRTQYFDVYIDDEDENENERRRGPGDIGSESRSSVAVSADWGDTMIAPEIAVMREMESLREQNLRLSYLRCPGLPPILKSMGDAMAQRGVERRSDERGALIEALPKQDITAFARWVTRLRPALTAGATVQNLLPLLTLSQGLLREVVQQRMDFYLQQVEEERRMYKEREFALKVELEVAKKRRAGGSNTGGGRESNLATVMLSMMRGVMWNNKLLQAHLLTERQQRQKHQQEVAALTTAVRAPATQQQQQQQLLDSTLARINSIEAKTSAAPGCMIDATKQLNERIDHVVTIIGELGDFTSPATISSTVAAIKASITKLQTRPDAATKNYKMPHFDISKFDDYNKSDALIWWQSFLTEASCRTVPTDDMMKALYLQLIGGAQAWMNHLAATKKCTIAELHTHITWKEFEKLWFTRFMVRNVVKAAMNEVYTCSQGSMSTRDCTTKWQKIVTTPGFDLSFTNQRSEFFSRSCAGLRLRTTLGNEYDYASFQTLLDRANLVIQTDDKTANEWQSQPHYVAK